MNTMEDTASPASQDLISLVIANDWSISIHIAPLSLIVIIIISIAVWIGFRWWAGRRISDFEIDSAELGLGDHKVTFKPNDTDRQIAYSIWVELSTRKIGLPIDVEDDVIAEIYDSWYAFFAVTRELIKDIPVSKVRDDSTGKIIDLSIEVLNEGLRPHLTKWQARFRYWYEQEMENKTDASPQKVQKRFPKYEELCADLLIVNERLIKYRSKMNELVRGK